MTRVDLVARTGRTSRPGRDVTARALTRLTVIALATTRANSTVRANHPALAPALRAAERCLLAPGA